MPPKMDGALGLALSTGAMYGVGQWWRSLQHARVWIRIAAGIGFLTLIITYIPLSGLR